MRNCSFPFLRVFSSRLSFGGEKKIVYFSYFRDINCDSSSSVSELFFFFFLYSYSFWSVVEEDCKHFPLQHNELSANTLDETERENRFSPCPFSVAQPSSHGLELKQQKFLSKLFLDFRRCAIHFLHLSRLSVRR